MERVSYAEVPYQYNRFEADIGPRQAAMLRFLCDTFELSAIEQVRRIIATYHFSWESYTEGSMVYAQDASGVEEVIPLFYPSDRQERKVRLAVNMDTEVVRGLITLGLGNNEGNTNIMENAIRHYAEMKVRAGMGQKLIVKTSEGKTNEVVLM